MLGDSTGRRCCMQHWHGINLSHLFRTQYGPIKHQPKSCPTHHARELKASDQQDNSTCSGRSAKQKNIKKNESIVCKPFPSELHNPTDLQSRYKGKCSDPEAAFRKMPQEISFRFLPEQLLLKVHLQKIFYDDESWKYCAAQHSLHHLHPRFKFKNKHCVFTLDRPTQSKENSVKSNCLVVITQDL